MRPQRFIVSAPPERMPLLLREMWTRGHVSVPVDPLFSEKHRRKIEEVVRPTGTVSSFDDLPFIRETSPDDLALILFTSGSTGESKGVMIPRRSVSANARVVSKAHNFPEIGHVTCLSPYHINAICMSILGGPGVWVPDWRRGFDLIRGRRIDWPALLGPRPDYGRTQCTLSVVPALIAQIVESGEEWPEDLKYLITAASRLPEDLARAFHTRFGPGRIRQGYGLSEAANFVCLMPHLTGAAWERAYLDGTPPVGPSVEGQKVRIENGEIQILATEDTAIGHWPDRPLNLTSDGWLHTGDLGEWTGDWIRILGRSSDTINIGGKTRLCTHYEDLWADLARRVFAVPAVDVFGDEAVGAWTHEPWPEPLQRADTVQTGMVLETGVGKPRRRAMGALSVAGVIPVERFEKFRAASIYGATQKLFQYPRNDPNEAVMRDACNEAVANMSAQDRQTLEGYALDPENTLDWWIARAIGTNQGGKLITQNPERWRDFNAEVMGDYATLAAAWMDARYDGGEVLEVGGGTGVLSGLLDVDHLTRTDLSTRFMRKFTPYTPDELDTWNFNEPLPDHLVGRFSYVIGVNSLHCAEDKAFSMAQLHTALRPGGWLLLSEGSPEVAPGIPHPIAWLSCLFSGWWDIGGFLDRDRWLDHFHLAEFRRLGWSNLRAGRYVLGGLVWGQKA